MTCHVAVVYNIMKYKLKTKYCRLQFEIFGKENDIES